VSYKLSLVLILLASAPALAQPEPTPAEPAPAEPTPPPPVEPAPGPAPAVAAPAKPSVAATPDLPGISIEKGEKAKKLPLELKPGGYAHFDSRRLLTDTEAHEMTIRRLRFKLDGSATKYFKFRTLIDFAGSKLVVNDAWAEIVIRPELSLRAGKDKSQFGIERLQSATQLTFIERAFPTQLSPNRDIGAWLRGDIEKGLVHYAIGAVDGVADNAVLEGESDDVLEFNLHVLVSPFAKKPELGDLGIGGATTFGRTHGTLASPGVTNLRSASQATIVKYTAGMDAATTARADGYRSRFAGHAYYYTGPIGVLAEYVRDREPIVLMGDATLLESSAWQLAASVAVTRGDKPRAQAEAAARSREGHVGRRRARRSLLRAAPRSRRLRDRQHHRCELGRAGPRIHRRRELVLQRLPQAPARLLVHVVHQPPAGDRQAERAAHRHAHPGLDLD
jgi:phosphate-selective porin OprO and OprP